MIVFDENLRCTQKLSGKVDKIRKQVSRRKLLAAKVYCVAFPSNGDNILDIYNTRDFLFKYYRKGDAVVHIIGIAESEDAAQEMVREIIDEVYSKTGNFDVERYFLNASSNTADT